MGLVRAPLASEVDLLVATAAAGGGGSATAPTSFRLPLATQVGLGLEALERSPGLEQGAVDGEVIVGEQVLLASLPQHWIDMHPPINLPPPNCPPGSYLYARSLVGGKL